MEEIQKGGKRVKVLLCGCCNLKSEVKHIMRSLASAHFSKHVHHQPTASFETLSITSVTCCRKLARKCVILCRGALIFASFIFTDVKLQQALFSHR